MNIISLNNYQFSDDNNTFTSPELNYISNNINFTNTKTEKNFYYVQSFDGVSNENNSFPLNFSIDPNSNFGINKNHPPHAPGTDDLLPPGKAVVV